MAQIFSNTIQLGISAPDFKLKDYNFGGIVTLNKKKGKKGTLIMFICNHCPYVKHVIFELINMANDFQSQGISFIAINSNDVQNYPEDSPEQMKIIAHKRKYSFVYLYDETQEIAKNYHAACTPDFYLFNSELELVYHGQMDNSRPDNMIPVTGNDLRLSMNNLILNVPISKNQKPSLGCSIKWKTN